MTLTSLSPLDGRYCDKTRVCAQYFCEENLIKTRLIIETKYLLALSTAKIIRQFTDQEKKILDSLCLGNPEEVKNIEKQTNHDVKAIEYFIKKKLKNTSLADITNFVHFGLTSEDVNNLAYSLIISGFIKEIYQTKINNILDLIIKKAEECKNTAMLARTHGQPATPTTLGKELSVFVYRLKKQLSSLPKLSGKLAGASGNFNALVAAYPHIDWLKFSENFVKSLNLEPWLIVTQIEPHDRFCELFGVCQRINNILLDFTRDIWFYICLDYFSLKLQEGEVGSSTMPHKINPIDFENAEGNLGLANALFSHFIDKLPISRLQRDLSDSTVQRSIGSAFGYTIIAFQALSKGLEKIQANQTKIKEDLQNHPEILAEAYQTILRRENIAFPYEKLKQLTQGKKITLKDLHSFIDKFRVSDKVKQELKNFRPENYLGLASILTEYGLKNS